MMGRLQLSCWAALLSLFLGATAPAAGPRRSALRLEALERFQDGRQVRTLLRDGERVWVATSAGLRLFRDQRLLPVVGGEGLGALYAIYRDGDGMLWLGGEHGALHVRVVENGASLRLQRISRIRGAQVRAIIRHKGRIYLGTWGKGLCSLTGGRIRTVRGGRARSLLNVSSLASAGDLLYVGTVGGGVAVYGGRRIRRLPSKDWAQRLVWALASDDKGRVWAATSGGLRLFATGREAQDGFVRAAARLPVRDLRSVIAAGRAALWVGSFGGGAHELRADAAPLPLSGVSPTERVAALLSFDGGLIGTGAGLLLRRGGRVERLREGGPCSNDISALARGRSGLWVGTFDGGLSHYQAGSRRWKRFGRAEGLIDTRINHLALQTLEGKEVLWVATPRGVSRYAQGRWQRYHAGEDIAAGHANAIYVGADGRVYVASGGGVSIYGAGRWTKITAREGFPLRSATAVHRDVDGVLWVGGIDGLARLEKGRWTLRTATSGDLPDDWVTGLIRGAAGRLWVGTYDGGLAALGDSAASSERVVEAQGLPCGWVNPQAMARVGDLLLLGTLDGGLVIRDGKKWRRFSLGQGLPSRDVTAIVQTARAGEVWIGTRRGLLRARLVRKEIGGRR